MRFEVKRTLVAALVGFVLAWPALHPLLVQQMRSNPWHLFGMAMYTVPHRVSSIRIVRIVDGKRQKFERQRITHDFEQRLEEFVDLFEGLGEWAPTQRLHAALKAIDPEADSFIVVPTVLVLNLETGILEERKHRIPVPAR